MWKYTSLLICLVLTTFALTENLKLSPNLNIPLKIQKSSAERVKEHGYPAESHFLETSDGYILNVFRIPYSSKLNNENDNKKPIVLLQHGLFSSSDSFLLNGPDNAIAYNFADAGFDVWLGNARGNIYSRNNTKISVNHPYFWRFSWHEIGVIDMPETIDYILNMTGASSLHYVGHSQGTTVYFVMTSSRPEYNDRIKTAHMLAPVVFVGNSSSSLTELAPYVGTPGVGAYLFADHEFLPYNPLIQLLIDTACGGRSKYPVLCRAFYYGGSAADGNNLNKTLLPEFAKTYPAGSSTNQLIHYNQLYVSNFFRRYDFGGRKNIKVYGQTTPPDYALDKITSNLYLYYGLSDTAADYMDVLRLPKLLSNVKLFHQVPDPTWSHFDFLLALKVKEVINDQVVQYCKDYETEISGTPI